MSSPEPKDRIETAAEENTVVDWARAIALGVRDTAKDVVDAGRQGAREAYAEYWSRFDKKVKHKGAGERKPRP